MTMDTLFNCAFGIDIDPQHNPNNLFMVEGLRFFDDRASYNFGLKLRCKPNKTKKLIFLFYKLKTKKIKFVSQKNFPVFV